MKQWHIKNEVLWKDFGQIHETSIRSIVITSNGETLLTSDQKGHLKKWKIGDKCFKLIKNFGQIHQGQIYSISLS